MNIKAIIFGIFLMLVGYKILVSSQWLINNFGRIGFFDRHLGLSGGTRLGYKLIGVLIMSIGFFFATGLMNDILETVTAPIVEKSMH